MMLFTLPRPLVDALFDVLYRRVVAARNADFVIGADHAGGAYLYRWYLTPWQHWQSRLRRRAEAVSTWWNRSIAWLANCLPSLYLQCFLRDDAADALHDHPAPGASLILRNGYLEHEIRYGGIHRRRGYGPGDLRVLGLWHAHRVELQRDEFGLLIPCWSLFLFGPMMREWGFHCPTRGWVHWREFTAADNPGEIGDGCEA